MSKIIPLSVAIGPFNSKGLLNQVLAMSPTQAINVGEIRKRIRIMDAIDATDTELLIETDEWNCLKGAIETFPFNTANRQLLQIIDDVLNAPDGPVITKEMREAATAQAKLKAAGLVPAPIVVAKAPDEPTEQPAAA